MTLAREAWRPVDEREQPTDGPPHKRARLRNWPCSRPPARLEHDCVANGRGDGLSNGHAGPRTELRWRLDCPVSAHGQSRLARRSIIGYVRRSGRRLKTKSTQSDQRNLWIVRFDAIARRWQGRQPGRPIRADDHRIFIRCHSVGGGAGGEVG